jgi:hypothetical protein
MENRIFATYNSEGQYTGFYHTEFFNIEDIPTPNIELTEAQWNETFDVRCLVIDGVHTVAPLSNDEINQQRLISLRSERDKLLRDSDWTQMVSDIPLTEAKKEAWRVYRQALRDLPETADLENIIFPVKPE